MDMIGESDIRSDYSADVRLYLVVGERSWRLSAIGPDHFVPREPIELQPCQGEIVMTVDREERRWDVVLIDGVVPFDTVVRTRQRATSKQD
jgi:hypothetical protein